MLVTSTGGTITWMLNTSTDDASSDNTRIGDTSYEDTSTGDTSIGDTSTDKYLEVGCKCDKTVTCQSAQQGASRSLCLSKKLDKYKCIALPGDVSFM